MEMRCVWILLIATLAIHLRQTFGIKVVVVRENSDSRSEEESSDTLSTEESEEIDFLLDLIQKEAKDRNPPPLTTVKIIKKPDLELLAQHSVRKEKVQSQPGAFKEYHVHYHNHQHKGPVKPVLAFQEDSLNPMMWGPQVPLADFDFYRQLQQSSSEPFTEKARVKNFKDLESILRSNMKPSGENVDPEAQMEAFKDFDTFIKPKIPTFKANEESPYERFKKFHEYFDSEEEKMSFPQQHRFAAFKDFSDIENADKSKSEEKPNTEIQEKKTVKIKDFAIVIKSRPRTPQNGENANKQSNNNNYRGKNQGPNIPPFVNKLKIPNQEHSDLPKLLDAAGGTPKYIDALNKLRYPQPDILDFPLRSQYPLNLNLLESEQARLTNMRPYASPSFPMQPLPRYPMRSNLNGWFLRRLLRTK